MILKNRLAKGEITIEEFDKLKGKLVGNDSLEQVRDEITNVKQKIDILKKEQLDIQKKSENVTLLLSVLCGLVGILGIGHFYVKSKGKGIALLISGLFLDLIVVLFVSASILFPQNQGLEQLQQSILSTYFVILYGLIYLGLYFIQIFDSRRSCRKYNLLLAGRSTKYSTSMRMFTLLAAGLGILVIIGFIVAEDLSGNISKLNSLQQEQKTAYQENKNSQTLAGYSQAYDNWRACSQKAGSVYLSVCGNPPQSPFDTAPIDCSLSVNHWRCNPYYTENSGQKVSTTNSTVSQIPQIIQVSPASHSSGASAIISTKFGNIVIKLRDDVAPKTVANFEKLANSSFYDGTVFHRIIPGFVIQAGDPHTITGLRTTWGTGDAGYTIPPEFSDMIFTKYTVGMVRGSDVNSGSSQFFIMVGDAPWLDGKYTLFGQVISGQNVVDQIALLPTDSNTNQPVNADDARINKITIQK